MAFPQFLLVILNKPLLGELCNRIVLEGIIYTRFRKAHYVNVVSGARLRRALELFERIMPVFVRAKFAVARPFGEFVRSYKPA
jgi:hypothetical protein